jgi:hypothetical protein
MRANPDAHLDLFQAAPRGWRTILDDRLERPDLRRKRPLLVPGAGR